MKVLFCTDGSSISYNSITNLSKWVNNMTVDILCAADWSFLPDTVAVEDSEFTLKCTNSVNSILNYSENMLDEHGIIVRNKLSLCGSVVDCIMETVENGDYDTIVLGSNGKKGIQKWLGSVSQEIASNVKISSYIAKFKNDAQKILFATDYSESTKLVLKSAIDMLNLENKDIYLTTVYESPDYLFLEGNVDSNWITDTNKKQEKNAKSLLNDFENLFKENNLTVSKKIILSGNPANEIIKFSKNENIDLIVFGTKNRKYLARFLLSSVSMRVLEYTKSDVLIIRTGNHLQ